MAHFTEQQVLYFLVFFLISLLFVCLTMWLTCMCLDWRKRRGTKTVVTLALAEGELALATSRKLTQLRAAKEANRYYDTIIAIAVAFYSYISAVISRTSTNNYHPTLATFASTLHEAAKTMQSENARASSHGFLERVLDPHDSYRVGSLRTPRPSAPPPAPPSGRIPTVETDIPTASARMTLIDDFTDEEEEPRPVIGIAV